jgi:soluble lytic murein transglycosylase-like protein
MHKKSILRLDEYEEMVKKMKRSKFRMILRKTIFSMILIFVMFLANGVHNATTNSSSIIQANNAWSDYWFDYYNLGQYTDSITNKKLTKQKVRNISYAIGRWESGLDSNKMTWEPAVHGYAYGTYGLLSPTAKIMGWKGSNPKELLNPYVNARYSLKYFCEHIDTYKGDLVAALAGYNGGRCRIDERGRIKNQKYIDNVYLIYVEINAYYESRRTNKGVSKGL